MPVLNLAFLCTEHDPEAGMFGEDAVVEETDDELENGHHR